MRVFLRFVGLAALGALAGCTDESPTAPEPVAFDSMRRTWDFGTLSRAQERGAGWRTMDGYPRGLIGGAVFDELVFGPEALTNDGARGEVYSSASGQTYWALTETPWAAPDDSTAPLASRASLFQSQSIPGQPYGPGRREFPFLW